MKDSKFNVLLYTDRSQSAFFAAVYSAVIMMNMPNMHLTVVQIEESMDASKESVAKGLNTWPISPTSEWMIGVLNREDITTRNNYLEALARSNELFLSRALDIHYQVIYSNPNIPDTVETILECARKKSIELVVMGTGDVSLLKDLIFGSLAHTLQNKSPIPVLLVKNLSLDLLEGHRSKPALKLIRK